MVPWSGSFVSLWPILVSSLHIDPVTLGVEQITPKLSGLKNEHIFFSWIFVLCGNWWDTWCLLTIASAGEAQGWNLLKAHSVTYLVVDAGFWGQSGVGLLSETPSMWPLYVVWALYKYCGWFQGKGGGGGEREDEREGNVDRTVSDDSLAGMHHYLPWLLFIEAFTKSLPSSKSIDFPSWWGNVVPYNVVEEQWDWKYCCGCLGGCILPHSCLWFPSFPEPAPSPSSPLSWHLLVSFLHTLLIWLRFTGRMGVNVVLFYIFMFKQTKWSKWQHQLDNPGGKRQSQEKCLQSLGLPDFLLLSAKTVRFRDL